MCQRLGVLLGHICANATARNVKETVQVLMPFVQGATESLVEEGE